jgi:hypothetical protein
MNLNTINILLKIIVLLFILISLGIMIFLFVGDISGHNKVSLLIQSGVLLICSLWMLQVFKRVTKNKEE